MKKTIAILILCSLAIAEVVISPNMNLPVPVVGSTPGPDWANNINSCMSSIDSHDHTPGHGVAISSQALDITSDLSLSNNSLTSTKAVVFNAQSSFSTNQSVYVISPDLIYNDGNGNVVRITQNGSVSGASGTITGLPSGTASASYQSVGGTFQFQSATNTPANISGASLLIAEKTSNPNTITLKSPNSLGASYNVTFPSSLPSFTSLLTMSTSGALSTVGYKSPTVQKFTSGSGTYSLPTSPSPIYIRLIMVGGGGGGGSSNGTSGGTGGTSTFGSNSCTGGSGGATQSSDGGAGGECTLATGFSGALSTGNGGSGGANTTNISSGAGGGSALGGGARARNSGGNNGYSGGTNMGGGGSGATGASSSATGGGGGGYMNAIKLSPDSTYSYSVGAGGTAGSGSQDGGAGGSGVIIVEEYYQ